MPREILKPRKGGGSDVVTRRRASGEIDVSLAGAIHQFSEKEIELAVSWGKRLAADYQVWCRLKAYDADARRRAHAFL